MTFWDYLHRIGPGWPSERQWVTIWTFLLILILLGMANHNPALWDVEVFKVIVQAVTLTGALNMILAFHFAANKGDEQKSANTAAAFAAITATANATQPNGDDEALKDGDTVTMTKDNP